MIALANGNYLQPIPKQEACEFVKSLHYSKSVVWSSHTHLGVFVEGKVIGVLQFGPSMNPKATSKVILGLPPAGMVELNRMAFLDGHPKNIVSESIAASFRFIRAVRPAVQVVQSFADGRCKRLGVVYQASNFIYLGSHKTIFYLLDGEWFHKSLLNRAPVDKRGWGSGPKAARFAAGKERAVPHEFEQFRYAYPLTPWARRQLLPRALPYPKPEARNAIT